MKLFCFFLLISYVFLSNATAEEARLKTGEHENFTRLVFHLPNSRDWSVTKEDAANSILVHFSGPSFDIDLSAVFHRIGKNRVREVEEVSNGVRVYLACICELSSFVYKPSIYVLDISPIAPSNNNEVQKPIDSPVFPLRPFDTYDVSKATLVAPDQININIGLGIDSRAERALIENLGFTPLAIHSKARNGKKGATNIGAHGTGAKLEKTVETAICRPDYYSDTSNWKLAKDVQLAQQRHLHDLFSTYGVVNQEVAEKLGKHYLAFGLGLEAFVFLELSSSEEAKYLSEVSRIVDELNVDDSLISQRQCNTGEDFWAAISHGFRSTLDARAMSTHVIEYYLNLPIELQLKLSEKLAQSFTDASASDISDTLIPGYTRRNLVSTETATFISPDLRETSPSGQVKKMQKIIQTDTRKAPRALLEIFSNMSMASKSTQDDKALLKSFSKELGQSIDNSEWWATELHLAVAEQDQNNILSLLTKAPEEPNANTNGVFNDVFQYIYSEYGDIKFVKFALALNKDVLGKVSAEDLTLINERMVSLGFEKLP